MAPMGAPSLDFVRFCKGLNYVWEALGAHFLYAFCALLLDARNACVAAGNLCWHLLSIFRHTLQRGGTCAAHGIGSYSLKKLTDKPHFTLKWRLGGLRARF